MVVMATSSRWLGVVVMVVLVVILLPACVMGQTVDVGSIEIAPYLMEVKDPQTGQVVYDGYIKELLDKLAYLTNLNFKIQTVVNEFGHEDADTGQWTGLVGLMVNGEADMAAAPLTRTESRARVMEHSDPFQTFSGVVVLQRPPLPPITLAQRARFVVQPLEDAVWLMALVAYLLTSIVLYVICHVNPYEWRHLCADRQATHREAESFTCLNTFWFLFSTWMWQGFVRAPRSVGGRVVVTVWWIFVVVFLLTYTASLTNLLRVGPLYKENLPNRYLDLEGLSTAIGKSLDAGFVKGGATFTFLQQSARPDLARLYRAVRDRDTFVDSVEEGVERVRQSYHNATPFAFVSESILVRHRVQQEPCDLYMVRDDTISGAYTLGFPLGSPHMVVVNLALLELKESGQLKELENKWFGGACQTPLLDVKQHSSRAAQDEFFFHPVDLGSFSGVMILLAAGVVTGAVVTILEVVIFKQAEKDLDTDEARNLTGREDTQGKKGGDSSNLTGGAQNISAV